MKELLYILAILPIPLLLLFTEGGREILFYLLIVAVFWGLVIIAGWGITGLL